MKLVHARIEGRVQGVGFRDWAARTAEVLGLSGWVRNRRDGTVEAMFGGPEAEVNEMLARCGSGPPLAEVIRVVTRAAAGDLPAGFEVRPTE